MDPLIKWLVFAIILELVVFIGITKQPSLGYVDPVTVLTIERPAYASDEGDHWTEGTPEPEKTGSLFEEMAETITTGETRIVDEQALTKELEAAGMEHVWREGE